MTQTVESCEIECSTKGEVLGAFVYEGSSGRGCFCEQADASTIVHNSTIHRAAAISSYEIAELRKRRIRAAQAANQQMHMQAAHMHMPP